jgi:hypothetical protein
VPNDRDAGVTARAVERVGVRSARLQDHLLEINPTLGEIELQQLKPLHVRAWLAELLKTRSGRTVGNLYLVLNGALKEAVRLELIGRNPASAVTPPRSKSGEITILSEVGVCEGSA